MRGYLWFLITLMSLLTGCVRNELYRPYTLRHPGTGATVICGHPVWWECLAFDYEKQGFERVQEAR